MSLLEVRDLTIIHDTSKGPVRIVEGLTFSMQRGVIFGLAGESGCGKSLTALAMMGILPKGMRAEGSVLFEGEEMLGMHPDRLREIRGARMSMVFQEPMTSLNPVLKVGYQVEEVLMTHLKLSSKEAARVVQGLLRDLHFPSPEIRVREYPHQMSGGMRQRIMMAMAIACGPSILIADEPTTALDVTIEAQILRLIRELRDTKGMGVLLITHDLGIIAENSEEVSIMYAGTIVESARVEDLFASPKHPYTIGLIRSLPQGRGTALTPIAGMVPRPGEHKQGCRFADRCEYVIGDCKEDEPQLISSDDSDHMSRCIRAQEAPWN